MFCPSIKALISSSAQKLLARLSYSHFSSVDVDECSTFRLNRCAHNCTNTLGSYMCSCLPGYRLTNRTECLDINECLEGIHGCHEHASCTNLIGSHLCVCNAGFTGNGKHCRGIYKYISILMCF